MAYSAITDTEIQPGKPGSNSLFTRLRDNPIAMMAKSVGAPVLADNYIVKAMMSDNSVGSAEIEVGAVKSSELATASAAGSRAMAANTNYTLPAGWYLIAADSAGVPTCGIQVNASGWKTVYPPGTGGLVFSDGSNTRLNNVGVSTPTIHWRKFS